MGNFLLISVAGWISGWAKHSFSFIYSFIVVWIFVCFSFLSWIAGNNQRYLGVSCVKWSWNYQWILCDDAEHSTNSSSAVEEYGKLLTISDLLSANVWCLSRLKMLLNPFGKFPLAIPLGCNRCLRNIGSYSSPRVARVTQSCHGEWLASKPLCGFRKTSQQKSAQILPMFV